MSAVPVIGQLFTLRRSLMQFRKGLKPAGVRLGAAADTTAQRGSPATGFIGDEHGMKDFIRLDSSLKKNNR